MSYVRPDGAESIDKVLTEYVVNRHNDYIDTLRAQIEAELAAAAALLSVNARVVQKEEESAPNVSKNTSFFSMFF